MSRRLPRHHHDAFFGFIDGGEDGSTRSIFGS